MTTDAQQELPKGVQVGLDKARINYYDIMVIGSTGQGKSTTSDKIIIANPSKKHYTLDMPKEANKQGVAKNGQVKCHDISVWLALGSGEDEIEGRLKFLHYCRTKEEPHEEINRVRSTLEAGRNPVFKPTTNCEVLSNETTNVRLMDVPGFFDGASFLSKQRQEAPEGSELMSPLDTSNLDIMRKIIRIQTALSMKFNRILYFLPSRGPLERASAHLHLELEWMAHFFERAIFKSMVLVATVSPRFSKNKKMSEEEKFAREDIDMTKIYFRQALREVFNNPPPNDPLPDPPLIFISLTDTCEEILDKIKCATVQQEGLNLQIDPSACSECGVKIGIVKGQRVTCYFGDDFTNAAIPYDESTCHPCFIPKYSRFDRFWRGFKYVVSFRWAMGDEWPSFVGEKCAACGGAPNRRGCMKVYSEYGKGKQKITVDHTNAVVSAPPDEEADESSTTPVNAPSSSRSEPASVPTPQSAPPTSGSGPNMSQIQTDEHCEQNDIVNQKASHDTESSMLVVQSGIQHMRIHNQSYVAEGSADNPVWSGGEK